MRKTAVLVGCSVLVALLAAEVGLRLLGFPNGPVHSISKADYDRVPGMHEPGFERVTVKVRGLPHHVRINSLGFRGPEPDPLRTRPRVLCVGDSFTYGDSVDDSQTLTWRLQAQLGERVEFLNGGVAGSTIVDQQIFLERMLVLDPDLVLLLYSENDLSDLRKKQPFHKYLEHNRELRKAGAGGLFFNLARDTSLFNLGLKVRAAASLYFDNGAVVPKRATLKPRERDELIDRYVQTVLEIQSLLARRNVGFILAAYPWPENVSAPVSQGGIPRLREALAKVGITLVDLTPPLRDSGFSPGELYLLPRDGHPSPLGYEIAANALAPAIETQLTEAEKLDTPRFHAAQDSADASWGVDRQ